MSKELYISVDVETDGPYPGGYSMASLGATVAGSRELKQPHTIERYTPTVENGFYRELKPISENYVPEALMVGSFLGVSKNATVGEVRDHLTLNGADPEQAMEDFIAWGETMREQYEAKTLVFAAYPLGFDWLFTYWYLCRFGGDKAGVLFSHGRHVDMKSYFAAKWDKPITGSTKRNFPKRLFGDASHTHNALDDAIEQGQMFMNMLLA